MESPLSVSAASAVDSVEPVDSPEEAAFRIQVAAVVAQQAALTEQEIELGEVHNLLLYRVDELLADVRQAEQRLADREMRLLEREANLVDLSRECAHTVDGLREALTDLGDKRRLLVLIGDALAGAESQIERLQSGLERMSRLLEPVPALRAYAA
jgi:chromosome segregation ATPase